MKNGEGLLGHWSSKQSAIIVPFPDKKNKFYIITTDGLERNKYGLRSSIVDMLLEGGLGRVISQNNFLLDSVTENVTAIRKCNSNDYWLLSYVNYKFYVFNINQYGISNPIINDANFNSQASRVTNIRVSPDREKIILGFGDFDNLPNLEIYDFDNLTGKISNPIVIKNYNGNYGFEWSPDGTKLYLSTLFQQIYYNLKQSIIQKLNSSIRLIR